MKQKSLFPDFPDAEIPENFQSQENIEKVTDFPESIMVKCLATNPAKEDTYKSPLWYALKKEFPNLIVSASVDEAYLQLRVHVWAKYAIDAESQKYLREFDRGRPTPEFWATLKRVRQSIAL